MKRYISKFRSYFHIDKELDEEHYGYNREDVEEKLSDIETYVSEIENCIFRNEIGMALKFLEELKEML